MLSDIYFSSPLSCKHLLVPPFPSVCFRISLLFHLRGMAHKHNISGLFFKNSLEIKRKFKKLSIPRGI